MSRSARALAEPSGTWRLVSTLALVGCSSAAAGMLSYPGGNRFDPSAKGYDFWRNFLCDGTNAVAVNGVPNLVGAHLLQFGLGILAASFLPLWWALPRLISRGGIPAALIKWAGSVGTLLMIAVILSERHEQLHDLLFVAGPLCIVALGTTLAELAFEWRAYVPLFGITAGLASTAAINLYYFAQTNSFSARGLHHIPAVEVSALQKVVSLLGICWLLVAAAAVTRSANGPATGPCKRLVGAANAHRPVEHEKSRLSAAADALRAARRLLNLAKPRGLMTHQAEPSRASRTLAYVMSMISVFAFGVSQFASSCRCGGGNNDTRSTDCTPSEWDDSKWQNVTAEQQLLTREVAESAYAQKLAKIVAPYKTLGDSHSRVLDDGSEPPRGALILGGRRALAGFESLLDEEALALELESTVGNKSRTGLEAFLDMAAPSDDPALNELLSGTAKPPPPTDGDHVGVIRSAITDGTGNPVQPVRFPQSPDVALNIVCVDGAQIRVSGWLAATRVAVTAGHVIGMAQPHGGIASIDIIPPAGPSAPNSTPARLPGLAYQVEPAYTHPNGADDIMMIYFQAALPARATTQSPVVDYQSVIATGCANPGNCIAQNVQITATGGPAVFANGGAEWNNPAIRTGQANVYYQEQQGNSQWLYLFPPITEAGDSGGAAWINGQLIGHVWGTRQIPVNYAGQVNPNHIGTVIQLLDGNRLQNMITVFQNNVQNLIANARNWLGQAAIPNAPWRTADQRFGILVDYNQGTPRSQHWTTTTLANALAAFVFFAQWNPPAGGCNHP